MTVSHEHTLRADAVRTLIVDDEEPARELLRSFLVHWPSVHVVGEAADGEEALALVDRELPDLVFLDVQMPRKSGFDVVASLNPQSAPLIVFVTAHDQYALRAFEVCACDYLLKPFDADRLGNTMRRVLQRREVGTEAFGDVRRLLAHLKPPVAQQVVVKSDGRHIFLNASDIDWLEAVGKEVHYHVGAKVLVGRETMNNLERTLDATVFVRVHRSAIVNRTHICEMQPWFKGDYVLVLRNGARVSSGRTFRSNVQRLLGL